MQVTPVLCQRKWNNLLRTYKATKDNKNGTGRAPTRFLFFKKMDDFLGDKPNISSPHAVDVSKIPSIDTSQPGTSRVGQEFEPEPSGISSGETMEVEVTNKKKDERQGVKRKNFQTEYYKAKTRYYNTKTDILKQKQKSYEQHLAALLEIETRKANWYERKVTSSEKRSKALEEMLLIEKQKTQKE